MAISITPTTPISTLQDAVAFLIEVRNDIEQTLTETLFFIELLGKTYTVRRPFKYENPRVVWDIIVDDGGLWPDRSSNTLGYQWQWEYAIDTIISDVVRFYPSPDLIDGGLYLHLDASNEDSVIIASGTSDEVEQWLDLGDNGFTVEQDTTSDRPLLVETDQNGLNVISFDGISQHFLLSLNSFKDWTLFVIGKFVSSANTDRGTFLAAMGREPTFGGLDAYVLNSAVLGTEGSLQTYVDGRGFLSTTGTLTSDTYDLSEWAQEARLTVVSDAGVGGTIEKLVDCEDLSDDFFDTTRQPGVDPTPTLGAIGRTNAGTDAGFDFNYLEGSVGEIILYNRVLSDSERIAVRTGLIAKWQL